MPACCYENAGKAINRTHSLTDDRYGGVVFYFADNKKIFYATDSKNLVIYSSGCAKRQSAIFVRNNNPGDKKYKTGVTNNTQFLEINLEETSNGL